MSSRRGPWPAGACVVGLPFESFLAPQAAFGCHRPWGVGGLGTVSRHPAGARGGGGGGVAPSGPPSFAVPPLAVVFAGARPARPSAPRLPHSFIDYFITDMFDAWDGKNAPSVSPSVMGSPR